MQLDPLIRPLAAGDAVVHVGPGALDGHAAYPRTAATVILVEADPDRAQRLARKTAGHDTVRLVAAALRPDGASARPLRRYNLPDLDGFSEPTGAYRLFPGLRARDDVPVTTVAPAQLLEMLPPPQGRDLLIVEAAGETRAILDGLDRRGALDRFASVVLRPGRAALCEADATAAALAEWLGERGFAEPVTLDDTDPDWPVLLFRADTARGLLARLPALSAAAGEGWITLSDLGAALEPGRSPEARLAALRDVLERRGRELAETRSAHLVEAQKLLADRLAALEAEGAVTTGEAEMFRVQLDQLRHELSLALRRGQLGAPATGAEPLARRSVAQLGQDLWVLERTGHKRGGFFVEFGATDGLHLSNTWLLETGFDWRGICAEPNPAFFAALKENRRCTVTPDCVHDRTGAEVEFILADEYGVVAEHADLDQHADKRAAFREAGRTIRVTTVSLDDLLRRHDAPRAIDYVSIDTEGTEFLILDAFPFAEWDIGLFTVEHNHTPNRDRVRALMARHGYACRPADFDDWFYRP